MAPDDEALVAALQLLLGDKSDDYKRSLYYKAFPESFVLLKSDGRAIQIDLQHCAAMCSEVIAIADGSSGLGVLAVKNIGSKAAAASVAIRRIAATVGMKL